MSSLFRLGSDNILRCEAFSEFAWQRHGFGTRLAAPYVDVTLRQVHSANVMDARLLSDRACEGDALISDSAGQTIGVRTADCVPILLLDGRNRAVAAVHAGWRGTAAAIVQRTISEMSQLFGSVPSDLYAAIGPCIQACCYEVGDDVRAQFSLLFPEMRLDGEKHTLDLAEANRRLLTAAGVHPKHIFDAGLCTRCEADLFFSYRREPNDPGRMLSVIGCVA